MTNTGITMHSIAHKVEQLVSESAFLTEGLAQGLINLSELARQLRPQLETDLWKPVGQAAVVMALRRVAERMPANRQAQPILLTPRMNELTSRNELSISTFRLTDTSHECQRQLLALAEPYPGMYVTITRGVHEMLVVCSRSLTHLVDQAFATERLLARVDNLTALTLRLNPGTHMNGPANIGIYHAVLKQLAWDKISVINMMCTFSELTILLEQSQTGAAFTALSQIVGH
jgi:hypothetical protein